MVNGKANTQKKLFSRETSVQTEIEANPEAVWALLTDADGYSRWNSTLVSLKGTIEPGGQLELVAKIAPQRTFKLKVKAFEVPHRLAWGDFMGTREFSLTPMPSGTQFEMREKIGGPLFPLFAWMIPSFDESFERFASDLKAEAEQA